MQDPRTTDKLHLVRSVLRSRSPIEDAQIFDVLPHVQPVKLNPGDFLLSAGERATHAFIVASGLLREYHLDREGRQATRGFSQEGTLSGSLADLLSGSPAISFIEALEPTIALSIPWVVVESLAQKNMQWQLLLRRIAEGLYVQKVHREHAMLTLTAAERLAQFHHNYPGLWDRVPRHAIASYLGITPVHLSRLAPSNRQARQ